MWPFPCPFDQIAETHLRDLIPAVRESYTLEYKSRMYATNDSGSWNLLKDVSALANASGGHIIIGMMEDDKAEDGTPKELAGIAEGDTAQHKIESLCHDCIDPNIVGLRVRDIPLESGKSVVLVYIPNSGNKPHMALRKKKRVFYARHERQNLPMTVEEIRQAVLVTHDATAAHRQYIEDRQAESMRLINGYSTLWTYTVPLFVGAERVNVLEAAVWEFPNQVESLPVPPYTISFGSPLITLEGLEIPERPATKVNQRQMRIHRTGYLDLAELNINFSHDNSRVDPSKIEPILYRWTRAAYEFNNAHLPGEPIVLGARLLNVVGTKLWFEKEGGETDPPDPRPCEGQHIILPELRLASIADWRLATKRLMDRLYNAYNLSGSPNFNTDGQLFLTPPRWEEDPATGRPTRVFIPW